jgi:putative pyruvate formate lyase activating enzyme
MDAPDNQQFAVPPQRPKYRDPAVQPTLEQRAEDALAALTDCRLCPRECGVDRTVEAAGICQTGRHACVASAFPHLGEEDCLRGWHGSGTIFFAGCNLRCVFCQNWDISQGPRAGVEMDADRLAAVMLDLQEQGCHNINLVTPTHVVPQVIEALARAVDRGLQLPVVYNTSAYDRVSSLKLLDGLIDIYMPDFKFWSSATARQLANAPDYPERARAAIREMHRQVGDLHFTPEGIAQRGLLVRQLVMPGQVEESRQIYTWLAGEISRDTFVNIMAQYRPEHLVGKRSAERGDSAGFRQINRRPTRAELAEAYAAARAAGLWRFDERTPLIT